MYHGLSLLFYTITIVLQVIQLLEMRKKGREE